MVRREVSWLIGGLMVMGLSGWCLAGEGEVPKVEPKKEAGGTEGVAKQEPKQVDELRSVIGKLLVARRKLVQSKPELGDEIKKIQDDRKAVDKKEQDFNAKLRTLSPEIDAFEKQREEIEAARKAAHKAPRPPKK